MPEAKEAKERLGLNVEKGIILSFQAEPDFDLAYDSLDLPSKGIQLLATDLRAEVPHATVFVPDGQLDHFLSRLEQYAGSIPEPDSLATPKHANLLDAIAHIRAAAVDSLWTDFPNAPPAGVEAHWWEVWFRRSPDIDFAQFAKEHQGELSIRVAENVTTILDRQITLISATRTALENATRLLTGIAEIRRPHEVATSFTSESAVAQYEWMDDLLPRVDFAPDDAPRICILDTGVNRQHPLLSGAIDANDVKSYNGLWAPEDFVGHGTEMAGLCAYGDLIEPLAGTHRHLVPMRIESCKIFDPQHQHDPDLYGSVTRSAVGVIEADAPHAERVFLCAVSADSSDGSHSEWSATIDGLASGSEDLTTRLFVVSAGNCDPQNYQGYIDSNLTDSVQDPGQAMNALTVGAYTEKWVIDATAFPYYSAIAPVGDLSPSSTTSGSWPQNRRFKPDIVLEGGNIGIEEDTGFPSKIESLQLLTTGHDVIQQPLVVTDGTSAASALAANLAASAMLEYPNRRPETIRALLVHSAEWTPQMHDRFAAMPRRRRMETMLSAYGYGVPNKDRLLWSIANSLTVIAEETLQPFRRNETKTVVFNEMHLHALPWPTALLEQLGQLPIQLKVTLAYFVEPSPGKRGASVRYRYASHGLRFDMRRPLESREAFVARINNLANEGGPGGDGDEWALGSFLRNRGCIQSDIWAGTAADLASKDHLAVYPVAGWWKFRRSPDRHDANANYSLVLSISTPQADVDLYTPIAAAIAVKVKTAVAVQI